MDSTNAVIRELGGVGINACLRKTIETLYEQEIMFEGIEDGTFVKFALEAMAKDWEAAFSMADIRFHYDMFTEDEWLALYGSQNGNLRCAGTAPMLRDNLYDYFYYNNIDDHPLMRDKEAQAKLIEKLAGLSYFDELVLLERIRTWWQKN